MRGVLAKSANQNQIALPNPEAARDSLAAIGMIGDNTNIDACPPFRLAVVIRAWLYHHQSQSEVAGAKRISQQLSEVVLFTRFQGHRLAIRF